MADLSTRQQRPAQAPRLPDWGAAAGTLARLRPGALWRDHRLFTILVLLALMPRVLAALAFRPALLTADSFLYMQGAVTGSSAPSGPRATRSCCTSSSTCRTRCCW